MSVPFIGKFQFLNGILDQFVDCKFIIHHYTQFTVHKLRKKIFSTAFLWFTIDTPPTTDFSGNHMSTPGGQNWKKKQWLPPLGCSGGMVQQF